MSRGFEDIANDLIGTAQTPVEVENLMNDSAFCAVLDTIAFNCTECGWWCPIDEEESDEHGLEEWTCQQCCEEIV